MAKANAGPANPDQDDLDKMFGEDGAATVPGDDSDWDEEDLLGKVEEDDSEGWVPKEAGEGIVGRVVKVTQTRSDFAADGQDPMVPTVVIETKAGIKWRVIGYSAVLKRELEDQAPAVGDLMAIKYFGERKLRTGKFAGRPYKHYGVNVIKAK